MTSVQKSIRAVLGAGGLWFPAIVAFAQTTPPNNLVGGATKGSNWTGIGSAFPGLCTITNWFFSILLVFAVVSILYSAFLFLTGGGDAAKVTRARQFLTWALVGIAVAFLARALVFIIGNFVGGSVTILGC